MASGSNSMIVKLQDLILIILKVSVLEVILLPLLLMISIMKRKNNLLKVLIYLSTKKKERTVSNWCSIINYKVVNQRRSVKIWRNRSWQDWTWKLSLKLWKKKQRKVKIMKKLWKILKIRIQIMALLTWLNLTKKAAQLMRIRKQRQNFWNKNKSK